MFAGTLDGGPYPHEEDKLSFTMVRSGAALSTPLRAMGGASAYGQGILTAVE